MRQTHQAPRGHGAWRGQASPAAPPAGVSVLHAGPSTILSPLAVVQATSSDWEEGRPAVPACSGVGGTGGHFWRNSLPPQTSPKSPCRCPLSRGRTLQLSAELPGKLQQQRRGGGKRSRSAGFHGHVVTCWQSTAAGIGRTGLGRPSSRSLGAPPPRVKFPLVVRGKSASF